jgi:hypothetical protein
VPFRQGRSCCADSVSDQGVTGPRDALRCDSVSVTKPDGMQPQSTSPSDEGEPTSGDMMPEVHQDTDMMGRADEHMHLTTEPPRT